MPIDFYQPKWKGRKKVRHFVAALAIGATAFSLHYVYKQNSEGVGWTRQTVVRVKDGNHRPPEILCVTVFLLNGTTTWTVPADFGALVSVECIGAGSGGNGSSTAGNIASGGGGAYAKITSTSTALTPGVTVINVGIGLGGAGVSGVTTTGNVGGDTWWNATSRTDAVTNGSGKSCAAQGGQAATSATGGLGGTAANSVGTVTSSGGNGTVGANAHGSGGAAGPNGAGASGSSTAGGSADGGTVAGPTVSAVGNSGTEFDATHGCGTGSFSSASPTRAGGLYGGAGNSFVSLFSGAGANGLLVIIYTPAAALKSKIVQINQAVKRAAFW
jgi:hypothetical protein